MTKDENDVCPTEMLVDLTIEEKVVPAFKLCSKSEFSSNTDQSKVVKNDVLDKMQKCIKDMDQCIMDMSPARLKAKCRVQQTNYVEVIQDKKVDATADDCPVGILVDLPSSDVKDSRNLCTRSMMGVRLKKSSVNDGSPPLNARKNQSSSARHHCRIPSPQSMSHISKEASKVINKLNNSFMFDENVYLTEEILPISINFDLDDTDPEDNLLNIDENICNTEMLNNKTSIDSEMKDISVSTEEVYVKNENNNPELDTDPKDNLTGIEEIICKTKVINNKTSIAAKTKDIAISTENFQECVIEDPDLDDTDTDVYLSSIEENIGKTEVFNKETFLERADQDNFISVSTGDIKESVIAKPDHQPKLDVLQYSGIKITDIHSSKKQSEIVKKCDSSVESSPCKIDDIFGSPDFHLSPDEPDDVFPKENLHNDKIETKLDKPNQKYSEIAGEISTSNFKFGKRETLKNVSGKRETLKNVSGKRETLKNVSNICRNIASTDSLKKPSPNIRNKIVTPMQMKPRIQLKKADLTLEPLSHEKTQLKKTVSAIEPRIASKMIRSNSFQFPNKSELISNMQKQSSPEQKTSGYKQSGIIQPKTISQTSSVATPSRRYSIATPLKNIGLKHPTPPGIPRYLKASIPRFTPQTGSRLSLSKSLQFPSRNIHSSSSRGLRQPNPSSFRKSEPSGEKHSSRNITPPKTMRKYTALSTSSKKRTCSKLSIPSLLPAALNKTVARELFPSNTEQ